ncbi:MAG: sugar ABC transporter substrate-binding protein [Treponema sp.]|jgi:multiple sugar transport system substrate-binding protein|nr:sugar ABC transporter substrate-binding protein [Treponema sp.]
MKKIAILGAILLLAAVMGFAGGNKQSSDARIQITYSFWGTPEEFVATQKAINVYNDMQNKVLVTAVQIPHDSYEAALNTRAAAGMLPDCGMMIEGNILKYANMGYLMDVSQMYGTKDAKPLDSITFKMDGKPVAYAASNEILIMYYNKKMFDAAGVPYPPAAVDRAWTWDEFVATAKKLTLDTNGRTPNDAGFNRNQIRQYGAMVENLTWQLEVWALSNGGGFYSPDGKSVIIDQDAAIEAIQKVADLHLKDNVAPLSPGLTDDGVQRSLIAGTVAMTTNGHWNIGTCLSTARDEQGLDYGIAVLPYMKNKLTINTSGAPVVFNQTKHPKEAMDFIKWYTQIENSWFLIELGIWMPPLESYYKDEALIKKWISYPAYPPAADYRSAVIDYTLSSAKPAAWFFTPNTADFNNLLQSILGEVWTGAKTARDVITANSAALKRIHAEK